MIGSAQSAHLVDSVILSRHTACLAPPNVAILRMYTSSESHFLLPAKRLALRMGFPDVTVRWLGNERLMCGGETLVVEQAALSQPKFKSIA